MRRTLIMLLTMLACGTNRIDGPAGGSRTIWRLTGQGFGMPAVDSGSVYFMSAAHEVIAVDKLSGTRRWTAKSMASGATTNGFNLVVAGGMVVMPDAALYGFDRATGAERWIFAPSTPPPGVGLIDTDGTTIYAGSIGGTVYALDAATGTPRWSTSLGHADSTVTLEPLYHEGVVYVGVKRLTAPNTGSVAALDATTGAIRWSANIAASGALPGGVTHRAVIAGDLVVFPIQDGSIRAFDRTTGAPRWIAPALTDLPIGTGGSPTNDHRPLALVGTTIVAGSTTGYVVGLDAATGSRRWRTTANRGSAVYPLAADAATVYVTHFGGQLAAFRASDGAVLWYAGDNGTRPGDFAMTPAIDAGRLYVAGPAGYFALRAQ